MSNNKPAIQTKLQNESFKVLEIVGKPGDELSSHQVDHDAVLQVMSGSVIYKEGSTRTRLHDKSMHSIPQKQVHALEFIENAKLLLFLSQKAKMEFSKS